MMIDVRIGDVCEHCAPQLFNEDEFPPDKKFYFKEIPTLQRLAKEIGIVPSTKNARDAGFIGDIPKYWSEHKLGRNNIYILNGSSHSTETH